MGQDTRFKRSFNLPAAVLNAVGGFDDALLTNTQLIMDVLNQGVREDPNYVLLDNDPSSPYHLSTTNRYWTRFKPLEPEAEKISAAIRAYLKTD
jgi:hypothetical protein